MARKRIPEDLESHDRWLISYADFITLLFAFFVVLYAMSSIQEKKFQQLSDSIGQALGSKSRVSLKPSPVIELPLPAPVQAQPTNAISEPISSPALPPIETSKPEPEPAESLEVQPASPSSLSPTQQAQIEQARAQLNGITNQLQQKLAGLINDGKVHISQSNWGIRVEINASILFGPAEAKLNPDSITTLQSIAEVLKDQSQLVHVEGHTDDKAINTLQFPSNWELSSARAASVVRLFIDLGIESRRLATIGYADNHPVATNTTPEGRFRNRRVELMILAADPEPETLEPTPSQPFDNQIQAPTQPSYQATHAI